LKKFQQGKMYYFYIKKFIFNKYIYIYIYITDNVFYNRNNLNVVIIIYIFKLVEKECLIIVKYHNDT
jgi:hypothetical protein